MIMVAGRTTDGNSGTAGQSPQSSGQDAHVSSPLHVPSPHLGGQIPQSLGQDAYVSQLSHIEPASPHVEGQNAPSETIGSRGGAGV